MYWTSKHNSTLLVRFQLLPGVVMIFDMDEVVKDKKGRVGKIVPIPDDYSKVNKELPYGIPRLCFVQFGG